MSIVQQIDDINEINGKLPTYGHEFQNQFWIGNVGTSDLCFTYFFADFGIDASYFI